MKPIDPNDLSKYLDPDAPPVPRRHLVPLSWHDVELHKTDDGLCAWRAYTCPVCCGTESDTRTGDRCQCAGIGARMRRLTLARIPWTYHHTSMDDLSPEGRQWVETYQPEGKGLRFLGSTGRGKTHRMLCAVRGLCERGISARYVSWALWLDDMRQELLLGLLVEVFERLARALLVYAEVVIGAVSDTLELLDAEGEFVFDVVGLLRIKRTITIGHIEDVQLGARDADLLVKLEAFLKPLVGEAHAVIRMAEVLDLHLLELTHSKYKLTGHNFVSKGLACLCNPKRNFHPCSFLHIQEIHKNTLCRLWS